MKKQLLSAAFLFAGITSGFAQALLTAANFNTVAGDGFTAQICDTTGVTQGPSGASVVWDFSSLVTTATDTTTAVACSATPHCSLFPGSNIAQPTPSTPYTNYMITGTTALSLNGYYGAADTTLTFSDPMDQIRYPFTYGTTFTDPFAGILTIGAISAHQSGSNTVNCDGYGTLKLPGGIVNNNVLRVHSSQIYVDSAMLFGTSVVESYTFDTYTWYTPDYHTALLTIAFSTAIGTPGIDKTVYYAKRYFPEAVTNVSATNSDLKLFPNPATGELNIQYTTATAQEVKISLLDILGREVAMINNQTTQGRQQISYNTTAVPKGLYIIRMQADGEVITRKIEIR